MALSPELRALDRHIGRQNTERAERLHQAIEKPWRVTYHLEADRPGHLNVHEAETPRALVRFLRDYYPATLDLRVVRIWEAL